jgi:predicted TIM-barrel fold metal-dependent hydrolase
VSFTESPAAHGLPSLHSGYWDPFLAACEETNTILCLHGGGSGWSAVVSPDAPPGEFATMLVMNAMVALVDWLWAAVPVRFPTLKIVMSESGLSWVPAIIERIDYVMEHSMKGEMDTWPSRTITPSEALRRSFWFSTIMDPIGIEHRHYIGLDKIMLESDYPHADSTWPDTQEAFQSLLGDIPEDEARMISSGNAAKLFGIPEPRD